jgi:hypothetical protein
MEYDDRYESDIADQITELKNELDAANALNAELLAALEDMLAAMAMEPLDIAAKYGPDAHPDEPLVDAAHRARVLIAREKGEPR